MTNADKYLKDNVDIEEFIQKLTNQICRWDELSYERDTIEEEIVNFLNEQVKPTLTEDERVILRNINTTFKCIGKHRSVGIYVSTEMYNDKDLFILLPVEPTKLFQFIKEGEEYSISELLGGDR